MGCRRDTNPTWDSGKVVKEQGDISIEFSGLHILLFPTIQGPFLYCVFKEVIASRCAKGVPSIKVLREN